MRKSSILLAGSAVGLVFTTPLRAQDAVAPAEATETTVQQSAPPQGSAEEDYDAEGEVIVVTGQKPRGSVVGDIPPENVLTSRDVRATGATSISELLDAVSAQTGSARGRGGERPILLLNGQRISGFRELRDLPPEAIERMEILPEEVALKYGYSADQRVVNIVLRRRFNSTNVEVGGNVATDGGYASAKGDAGKLIIREGTRTALNLHLEGNNPLYESERDIALQPTESIPPVDPRPFRTLVGANQLARLTGNVNRTILGNVSATLTGEAEHSQGRSRFGVPTGTLTDAAGEEFVLAFPGDPLTRRTTSDTVGLGFALNGQREKWRLSATGNADLEHTTSRADRGPDLSGIQAQINAGAPIDPLGDLGPLESLSHDLTRSTTRSLDVDATATGPLFALPAGDANATFKIGASTVDLESKARRRGIQTPTDVDRTSFDGSANLDLPLAGRASSIGRLGANFNGAISHLSDFGTLTTLGAGLNWAPSPKANFIASWTREEGAPSLHQLGDPLLTTDNVPFFDAVRGETVNVTTVTGGNPELDADRRTVMKIGGNWRPFEKTDIKLRGEFVHQSIDRPQISFPAVTPALEAAFPGRFVRDASGQLVAVDLRPVNADRSTSDTVRWGFDFTKPLKSRPPSEAQIAAFRQRAAQQGAVPPAPGPEGQSPSNADAAAAPGRGTGGGRFGGGRGGFGGGRSGGRLTLSATHTMTLTDTLKIGSGISKLDYLHGEALNAFGGRPRHQVEVQSGYYNNGLGARVSADWRSATNVNGGVGADDLHFSDYATVDLRLFANLGERFDLVSKHPFFRGSSVRFDINNIFNSRPKVRDGDGDIPLAYQADRLEPIGRTVGISFRKLFLPRRLFGQGGGRRGGAD
ncbi:MAG TPA: TonB-dependent receptor plug domain-containing protein [Sphingomicrobium sp.]|nr:TonB-dependent receptor plug domain-containing protein [Sphingomicrobium sp.]